MKHGDEDVLLLALHFWVFTLLEEGKGGHHDNDSIVCVKNYIFYCFESIENKTYSIKVF